MNRLNVFWKESTITTKIIAVNVVFFILTVIPYAIFLGSGQIELFENFMRTYFYAQSDWLLELKHLWTIFTYQFSHSPSTIWHLVLNMVVLYFVGKIIHGSISDKSLLGIYLFGGILGYVFFAVGGAVSIIPENVILDSRSTAILAGASSSIFALISSVTFITPNKRILLFGSFDAKLWMVSSAYLALSIFMTEVVDVGSILAHVGGVVFGLLYAKIKICKRWTDVISNYMISKFEIIKFANQKKSKLVMVNEKPPHDDFEYQEHRAKGQDLVDQILDKINKYGYDSLTKREKEYLLEQSKKE